MIKSLILCLFALVWSSAAFAVSAKRAGGELESVYMNIGSHTEFYNTVQENSSGDVRKFDFNPTVGAGLAIPVLSWKFLSEINWMLPFFKENNALIKNLVMIRADFGYDILDWLRLRIGTSLMWQNMHGKGGKTEINNGSGQSTFYYPDENRSSLNNTFDVGGEALFAEDWSLRFQTYTYSVFKAESRQLSYSLFITHYWDM